MTDVISPAVNHEPLTLLTERLRLTVFTPGDADEVFAAVTPSLTRWTSFEPAPSRSAFGEISAGWPDEAAANRSCFLVIREREGGAFIGMTGLLGLDGAEPSLGIWIAEAHQGRGFGTEAVRAVVDWARAATGHTSIAYDVADENGPSRAIVERLGGRIVATSTFSKPDGRILPTSTYRLELWDEV